MNEIEILGANRLEPFTRTREASRAVVVRDGLILLSHETVTGWVLVPGGGLCLNKVEETYAEIIAEYYEEYRYISYYFVCESTGSGQMRLTEAEKLRGLEPQWIPIRTAIDLFSRHQSYAEESEEKRGSYLREYTALQEYLRMR